jgi:hypothetical protein
MVAGDARAAIEVWLDRTAIAALEPRVVSRVDHLDPELMSEHARIAEKRHFSQVTADIRAADTDAMDFDDGFARAWACGFGDLCSLEMLWFF